MKNNRINLRLLYALSSIILVSNGLHAMTEKKQFEKAIKALEKQTNRNVKRLLKTNSCENCNLQETNLEKAKLEKAKLMEANLAYANLKGANLKGADLTGADLAGADLAGADLTGADLTRADLTMATGMTDEDVINSGAILDKNTTLPSGKKYSN